MYWNQGKLLAVMPALRLIETWDVLKSEYAAPGSREENRLIETWDVLK